MAANYATEFLLHTAKEVHVLKQERGIESQTMAKETV